MSVSRSALAIAMAFSMVATIAADRAPQDRGQETPILTGIVAASWQWEPTSPTAPPPYIVAPRLLEQTVPEYTPDSTRAGVQGHVIVQAVIDSQGRLVQARLLKGLQSDELNRRATQAAAAWRFSPAKRDGTPVAVAVLLTFSFQIHGPEETLGARADAVEMGSDGLVPPRLLTRELPQYPEGPEYEGIEGDVYIEAVVTAEGKVIEPKLRRGVGNDEMDKRALEAITTWTFEPGTKDGEPVAVIALFTVTYRVH